jgi:hypothetical protein
VINRVLINRDFSDYFIKIIHPQSHSPHPTS